MAADLLARIKQSPVLCDGAMGTELYAKGIFINRSYDELNLSQPDLIRGIQAPRPIDLAALPADADGRREPKLEEALR